MGGTEQETGPPAQWWAGAAAQPEQGGMAHGAQADAPPLRCAAHGVAQPLDLTFPLGRCV